MRAPAQDGWDLLCRGVDLLKSADDGGRSVRCRSLREKRRIVRDQPDKLDGSGRRENKVTRLVGHWRLYTQMPRSRQLEGCGISQPRQLHGHKKIPNFFLKQLAVIRARAQDSWGPLEGVRGKLLPAREQPCRGCSPTIYRLTRHSSYTR
eukprot:1571412-Rhodomonas_salina.2